MEFLMYVLAALAVSAGVVSLVRGRRRWGIFLVIVSLLLVPTTVSIFW